MYGVNQNANVVAEAFTQCFISHRHFRFATARIAKHADGAEYAFNVAALMITGQEFFAVQIEPMVSLVPNARTIRLGIRFERDQRCCAHFCNGLQVAFRQVSHIGTNR